MEGKEKKSEIEFGADELIGYDNLQSYSFNTKTKDQQFCKTCGSSLFIDLRRAEGGGDGS